MNTHQRRYSLPALLALAWIVLSGVAVGADVGRGATVASSSSSGGTRGNSASGTLKLCSKPIDCNVKVAGQVLRKDKPVMTVDNLKPGVYDVVFESKGGSLTKRARVAPGQTTVLFASLDSLGPDDANWSDPLKQQPAEPSAVYQMRSPVAKNPVAGTWNKVTGKKGKITAASRVGAAAENPADLVDAQIAFELARLLQTEFNPFSASRRYERALDLYRHIIEDFPGSPYVELAHYHAGRIYESMHRKEYGKALTEYQTVLRQYPDTSTDAAERIAKLYGGAIEDEAQPQLASIRTLDPIPPAEADGPDEVNQPQPLTASTIGVTGDSKSRKVRR